MTNATIYLYSSQLSWSSSSSVTYLEEDKDTRVTNSTGGNVYWWAGTGNAPTGGGTQLDNGNYADFQQGDDDLDWSFSDSSSAGAPPKISMKIVGKGGGGQKKAKP